MGDVHCAKCGEPWDAYGVRHGDMTPEEAKRFWAGEGCPCCRTQDRPCPSCKGTGTAWSQPCFACSASGVLRGNVA